LFVSVGDTRVGKTAIVMRYSQDEFEMHRKVNFSLFFIIHAFVKALKEKKIVKAQIPKATKYRQFKHGINNASLSL
jgi:GTPase SAR1 family protein